LCEEYKPTIGIIVPAMILAMQKLRAWKSLDMSHWRELSVGSTVIPEEMLDILFDKGVPVIRDLYGCTETHVPPFTFLIKPDTEHKLQLECNDQYEYKLDRHDQLWLKSPLLMKHYLNSDEELDSEGYWCTGDVFERKHNKLFYKSRKKDLIKINSHNVSPIAIENSILVIDGVDEVCVITQDRGLGEKYIVAIISTQDTEINKSLVMNSIKGKLMPYEFPKDIIVTDETLPRNQMGKIQRHVVQSIYGEVNEN
jgi:acyl-coenzyme A synthetase/AMP-(fatty) acid ligase